MKKPSVSQAAVWTARAAWVLLAFVPSPMGDALADAGRTAQITFTTAAWVVWATGVLAIAWLSPVSLTAIRVVAPFALIGQTVATLARPNLGEAAVLWPLVGVALAVAAAFSVFLPDYAAAHVQAAAYGAERRLPLRVPIPQIAPIVLAWLVTAGLVASSLFLVASEVWVGAVPCCLAAATACWFLLPRLHRFSRRWLVVVPAGVVVHDHVLLAETFMVKTHSVTGVRAVASPGEALDLSGVARGTLIAIELREAENLALSPYLSRMLGTLDAVHVRGYAIAPTLTGQALAALTKPPATT